MGKLKPCPFCKNENIIDIDDEGHWVACLVCGLQALKKNWNTRAETPIEQAAKKVIEAPLGSNERIRANAALKAAVEEADHKKPFIESFVQSQTPAASQSAREFAAAIAEHYRHIVDHWEREVWKHVNKGIGLMKDKANLRAQLAEKDALLEEAGELAKAIFNINDGDSILPMKRSAFALLDKIRAQEKGEGDGKTDNRN